jgi:hypothetical protein
MSVEVHPCRHARRCSLSRAQARDDTTEEPRAETTRLCGQDQHREAEDDAARRDRTVDRILRFGHERRNDVHVAQPKARVDGGDGFRIARRRCLDRSAGQSPQFRRDGRAGLPAPPDGGERGGLLGRRADGHVRASRLPKI